MDYHLLEPAPSNRHVAKLLAVGTGLIGLTMTALGMNAIFSGRNHRDAILPSQSRQGASSEMSFTDFQPIAGVQTVVSKPGPPGLWQMVSPSWLFDREACMFTYGPLGDSAYLLQGQSCESGSLLSETPARWYGAAIERRNGRNGYLARVTGRTEDMVDGRLLCWPRDVAMKKQKTLSKSLGNQAYEHKSMSVEVVSPLLSWACVTLLMSPCPLPAMADEDASKFPITIRKPTIVKVKMEDLTPGHNKLPTMEQDEMQVSKKETEIFKALDKDQSGTIDQQELAVGLNQVKTNALKQFQINVVQPGKRSIEGEEAGVYVWPQEDPAISMDVKEGDPDNGAFSKQVKEGDPNNGAFSKQDVEALEANEDGEEGSTWGVKTTQQDAQQEVAAKRQKDKEEALAAKKKAQEEAAKKREKQKEEAAEKKAEQEAARQKQVEEAAAKKKAEQEAILASKMQDLSTTAIADIVGQDITERQALITADFTRAIYDEACTFTDEIGTYKIDKYVKGTKGLFVPSKSHVDLTGPVTATDKEVTFTFSETLAFNIPFNPKVKLSGKVVLTRDPETGLIIKSREFWDQSVPKEILVLNLNQVVSLSLKTILFLQIFSDRLQLHFPEESGLSFSLSRRATSPDFSLLPLPLRHPVLLPDSAALGPPFSTQYRYLILRAFKLFQPTTKPPLTMSPSWCSGFAVQGNPLVIYDQEIASRARDESSLY
eukprot:g22667.t1